MKKHLIGAAAAVLTFILGLAVGSGERPALDKASVDIPASTQATIASSPSSEESYFNLIDDNSFHSKLNGWKLPLSSEPLSDYDIDGAKVIPLSFFVEPEVIIKDEPNRNLYGRAPVGCSCLIPHSDREALE